MATFSTFRHMSMGLIRGSGLMSSWRLRIYVQGTRGLLIVDSLPTNGVENMAELFRGRNSSATPAIPHTQRMEPCSALLKLGHATPGFCLARKCGVRIDVRWLSHTLEGAETFLSQEGVWETKQFSCRSQRRLPYITSGVRRTFPSINFQPWSSEFLLDFTSSWR
jgi:hypothetical protein